MDTEKKEELDRLREEFNEIRNKMAKLEQELHGLHLLSNKKKEKHNNLLVALQKQIWLLDGKRFCQECRRIKDSEKFSFLFLSRAVSPGTYNGGGYEIMNEIKYICADCYDEILKPHFHAGYRLRMPVTKKSGQFFVFSEGMFRPTEEVFKDVSSIKIREDIPGCYVSDNLLTVGKKL